MAQLFQNNLISSISILAYYFNISHFFQYCSCSGWTQSNIISNIICFCFTFLFKKFPYYLNIFLRLFCLFFIACFFLNISDKTVRLESKHSSISGSTTPSSSHTLKILGTPLPTRSPILIRLNI